MSFEIAQTLDEEVSWLADIIGKRMAGEELPVLPEPPRFSFPEVSYARFCQEHSLGPEERLVLVLALVPHYAPDILKAMASEENEAFLRMDKDGFLQPTGETALFLIAGTDRKRRLEFAPLLEAGHVFYRKDVIDLQQVAPGRSRFSGGLFMNRSRVEQFFYGRYQRPRFSPEFPAHLLESKLEWDDLVLGKPTLEKLEELRAWMEFEKEVRDRLGRDKRMRRGFRSLFYGPSGTGKTLAATLLGKYLGQDVFRVDLSAVVSKYVGETSKNLDKLFNTAEDKGWVLFFDEGDALFGKRASQSGESDKTAHYANQDIAYLLQRIENYGGLVIVASNLRKNMDEAFSRRFELIVHFAIPDPQLRREYWEANVPEGLPFAANVNLDMLARHELTIASIDNVINRACVLSLQAGVMQISSEVLGRCIRDENFK
jgi:hypothetical protein